MNTEQAIEILDAEAGDVSAELYAEAEQVVSNHPAASAELNRRQMADFRIRSAFNAILPPAGIEAACLDLFEVEAESSLAATETASKQFFIRPWMYAAAAAIAIFLLVQAPLRDNSSSNSSSPALSQAGIGPLLNDLGRQFGNFGNYHHQPAEMSGAVDYLTAKDAPVNDFMTSHFGHVVPDGCRILDVQGYRVSMVCLRTEPFMHLFVAPKEAAGVMDLDEPLESVAHAVAFLAWTDGEHLLILATRSGTCDDLKRHAAIAMGN